MYKRQAQARLVDTAYATGVGRSSYPKIWDPNADPTKDGSQGAFIVVMNIETSGIFKVDSSKTHVDVVIYYNGKAQGTDPQEYSDVVHFTKTGSGQSGSGQSGSTWTPTGVN